MKRIIKMILAIAIILILTLNYTMVFAEPPEKPSGEGSSQNGGTPPEKPDGDTSEPPEKPNDNGPQNSNQNNN